MALPACGFAVYADKAGQLPLAIERRAKGKRVTIINGVKGNARALCQSLTSLLGVGGTVHSKGQLFDVEVQGEQTERVSSALRQLACVRGPGGVKLKEPDIVERTCGYDEFLRQDRSEASGRRKERWEAGPREAPEPPENAPCRAWHGYWIYCNGHCEQSDSSSVWDDSEQVSGVSGVSAVIAPLSATQLDLVLQRLGLMAAVGAAVESYRSELQAARAERAQPKASLCAVQPPKETTRFTCSQCGASFTMRRTLEMHKRQHLNGMTSMTSISPEVPAWRWDSMSQARQEAEFFNEIPAPTAAAVARIPSPVDDEFLSPEEAQYVVSSSKHTLGSLLEHAVPVVSGNRRRKGRRTGEVSLPCPVCNLEFPESVLEDHVNQCLERANEVDEVEMLRSNEGDLRPVSPEELPEELLESLLQLQLPPEASDVFWSAFEFHREKHGVHDAFLAALEEALSWIPDEHSSASGFGNHELEQPDSPSSDVQVQVTCPVCNLDFLTSSIEEHVDQCLGASASSASDAKGLKGLEGLDSDEPQQPQRGTANGDAKNRWARRKDVSETLVSMPQPSDFDTSESAQDRISRLKKEAKARKTKAVR